MGLALLDLEVADLADGDLDPDFFELGEPLLERDPDFADPGDPLLLLLPDLDRDPDFLDAGDPLLDREPEGDPEPERCDDTGSVLTFTGDLLRLLAGDEALELFATIIIIKINILNIIKVLFKMIYEILEFT